MRGELSQADLQAAHAALDAWPHEVPFTQADFPELSHLAWRRAVRERQANGQVWMAARGIWTVHRPSAFVPGLIPPGGRKIMEAWARRTGQPFGLIPLDALNRVGLSTQVVVREVYSTTSFRTRLRVYPDGRSAPKGPWGPRYLLLQAMPAWHFLHTQLNPVLAALDARVRDGRISGWDWAHFQRILPPELWKDLVHLKGLPARIRRSRARYLKAPPKRPRPASLDSAG